MRCIYPELPECDMSAAKFLHFPELAGELRTLIWKHALVAEVKAITDGLPAWCLGDQAERRRQAFVGHDNLPPRRPRMHLRVRVRDPYEGRKMRLEEDDFETLVNCLLLSAVCREARAQAVEICRTLAPHVCFEYDTKDLGYLEPPEDCAEPVLLRDVHCVPGSDSLEHVTSEPTTLTVKYGAKLPVKSPERFGSLIGRFFGRKIENLNFELWINEHDHEVQPYLPGTGSPKAATDV